MKIPGGYFVKIRKYQSKDFAKIHSFMKTELGYSVSKSKLQTRIKQMCKHKEYNIFVAIEHHQVVGFIGVHTHLVFENPGKIMRIIALAVSQKHQKIGIGANLVAKAEQYAKKKHISILMVNSGINRTDAHQFYQKQGFFQKGYSFCKKIVAIKSQL